MAGPWATSTQVDDEAALLLDINVVRGLAMDAPRFADSGHSGTAMALAPLAYVLWTKVMRHDPTHPRWPDRDRFILSNGHASILLYSMLYLTGYDLTLDDIRSFRQWGSRTPGHPERLHTVGVEVTTGPLGQGFGNSVGMAIAERVTRDRYGADVCNHFTFVTAGDGCFEEGISHEAASLAGHLGLGHLICIFDDNHISIDGPTELACNDNVPERFKAYGWDVNDIGEVANDTVAIEAALRNAMAVEDKPSLIVLRSHIGWPSPNLTDSAKAHGDPFPDAEIRRTKEKLGLEPDSSFWVPGVVQARYQRCRERGRIMKEEWDARVAAAGIDRAAWDAAWAGKGLAGWEAKLPTFAVGHPVPTRKALNDCLNATAPLIPGIVAGSADLTGNTGMQLSVRATDPTGPPTGTPADTPADTPTGTPTGTPADTPAGRPGNSSPDSPAGDPLSHTQSAEHPGGRQIHYGIREHAMGAVMNGMACHGGILPVGGTFFVFSDYMRGAVRLAALSGAHVIYSWTHDSIGLGQDGPTHQPVEHLASLRAMPGLAVVRPADANECAHAWKQAVEANGPVALILTRQPIPVLEETADLAPEGVGRGAYILADGPGRMVGALLGTMDAHEDRPDVVIIATGSEVSISIEAAKRLGAQGIFVRVVSMPCWEWFAAQSEEYRRSVLPDEVPRLSVEAGSTFGWERWANESIGIDSFGVSAPGDIALEGFGFTISRVAEKAAALVGRGGPQR